MVTDVLDGYLLTLESHMAASMSGGEGARSRQGLGYKGPILLYELACAADKGDVCHGDVPDPSGLWGIVAAEFAEVSVPLDALPVYDTSIEVTDGVMTISYRDSIGNGYRIAYELQRYVQSYE